MASWNEEETFKFIGIWGEDSIQVMLEGSKRNKDVFYKISHHMEATGYKKNADQCKSKIQKLKLEYRKKKMLERKRELKERSETFEEINTILGDTPATQPPVVVESGEAAASLDSPSHKSWEEEEQNIPEDQGDPKPDESESRSETPVVEVNTQVKDRKRKKSSDKTEKMESLVEKIIKMQSESDHITWGLKKWCSKWRSRGKNSHEFQLQMMALLTNQRRQAQNS